LICGLHQHLHSTIHTFAAALALGILYSPFGKAAKQHMQMYCTDLEQRHILGQELAQVDIHDGAQHQHIPVRGHEMGVSA